MANTGIYDEDYDDIDSILEVESDADSHFAETETPADGYFSERPHPRDVFVENSSVSAEAEAKAREAAEQRASSSVQVPPSQRRPTASSAPSISWSEAHTSQPQTEPPPPDYEAATQASSSRFQSPVSPVSPVSPRQFTYGSLNDGPAEARASASYAVPPPRRHDAPIIQWLSRGPGGHQSMSDPSRQEPQADEETGLLVYRHPMRKRKRWCDFREACCRPMSTCNVVLILVVLVLILLLGGGLDSTTSHEWKSKPTLPGHGRDGNPPQAPQMPLNPAIPFMPPGSPSCRYETYSDTLVFDFHHPESFSFREFIESSELQSGRIGGNVVIRPAQKGQDVDIRLYLTYATTGKWKIRNSNHVQTENEFTINTPELHADHESYSSRPCMHIFVHIDVRPGITLAAWETASTHMNIEVQDGLFEQQKDGEESRKLQIGGLSTFTAVIGNLNSSYWSSRETEVEVISGSIKGGFALLDLLSLKTQSGSINVDVDPQKADKDHPRPAESLFKSTSGEVVARFPRTGYIPERDYRTRVEAISSSVSGTYILGTSTSLHTQSGSIKADLLPFFDRERNPSLNTYSGSGRSSLTVLPPYDYPDKPWAKSPFSQKTTTITGSIAVSYPQVWEGAISAKSVSGSIKVKGKDVRIVDDERMGPMRSVTAVKGDGDNKLDVQTTSGSIKINVGNDE